MMRVAVPGTGPPGGLHADTAIARHSSPEMQDLLTGDRSPDPEKQPGGVDKCGDI